MNVQWVLSYSKLLARPWFSTGVALEWYWIESVDTRDLRLHQFQLAHHV